MQRRKEFRFYISKKLSVFVFSIVENRQLFKSLGRKQDSCMYLHIGIITLMLVVIIHSSRRGEIDISAWRGLSFRIVNWPLVSINKR